MKKWLKNLVNDNDITILCISLFPFMAVATTFETSYIMGLSILLITILSGIVISLISKFINKKIRIYVYLLIAAIFTTLLDIFMSSYIEPLSTVLGIYIPLIAISITILNKDEDKPIKESIIESLKYGLIIAISLSLIGLIREVLGSNTITVMDKISSVTGYISKYEIFPANNIIPNQLLLTSAGAFLMVGLILGIIKTLKGGDTK
jgi:Na+-translocating ferredoxin:NAD+ oxidoreductase RnfE subunit